MSNTIINQNTIKNTETIVNEINNVIKTQQTTTAVSPTKEGPLVDSKAWQFNISEWWNKTVS